MHNKIETLFYGLSDTPPSMPSSPPRNEESAEPRTEVKRAASTTLNNRRQQHFLNFFVVAVPCNLRWALMGGVYQGTRVPRYMAWARWRSCCLGLACATTSRTPFPDLCRAARGDIREYMAWGYPGIVFVGGF